MSVSTSGTRLMVYPREHEYVFKGVVNGRKRVVYVTATCLELARNDLWNQDRDMHGAACVGRYQPDGTFVRIDS